MSDKIYSKISVYPPSSMATARYATSSGFASGLIHSSTSFSRSIRGIRSWMKEISSLGGRVSTTKWGRPSSKRYSPQSQVTRSPFG